MTRLSMYLKIRIVLAALMTECLVSRLLRDASGNWEATAYMGMFTIVVVAEAAIDTYVSLAKSSLT